jgi:hypothetical protein
MQILPVFWGEKGMLDAGRETSLEQLQVPALQLVNRPGEAGIFTASQWLSGLP